MITIIYTAIVSGNFVILSWIGSLTSLLDIFNLLQSSLCPCVVCKCICVITRVLVYCFLVRGHLVI